MGDTTTDNRRLGWVGAGRMGSALVARLLAAGCDVAVYNRTRAKAEPLAELGATLVDTPADLADRDVVFTMVGGPQDFKDVVLGPEGILSRPDHAPGIVVDSTTISADASAEVRVHAEKRGVQLLAAPVSGNPAVVDAGRLTVAVSGPREAYDAVERYLELFGSGVTYVGEGEGARIVKICHNLLLGIVAQTMAEMAVLAEKSGVSRAALMAFVNDSVMGSTFTRYKTPAYVNLDFTPTFTPALLLKDFDLGLEAAHDLGVPMPVAAIVQQIVLELIGNGYTDVDFAALLELEAKNAGLELAPEGVDVGDGLGGVPSAR